MLLYWTVFARVAMPHGVISTESTSRYMINTFNTSQYVDGEQQLYMSSKDIWQLTTSIWYAAVATLQGRQWHPSKGFQGSCMLPS